MPDTILHTCSICSCQYSDSEGGVDGHFGMLPVNFCPSCFSCIIDMAEQYLGLDELEISDEALEVFEALKGVREVVINNTYGGFDLSPRATIEFLERAGIPYTLEDRESRDSTLRHGPNVIVNGTYWSSRRDIARDDPILVQIVKELGQDAAGPTCRLSIVKIPGDVKWVIDEYDGKEWIAEAHRTWR